MHLGTTAEVLGLVTWNVSWPAIIVQARLVTLGRQYEEAAADLGANRFQAIRRVLLPLLAPAIFASAVLVFSGVIDDFVIVDLLSSSAGNTPMSVIIYSHAARRQRRPRAQRARHDHARDVVHHRRSSATSATACSPAASEAAASPPSPPSPARTKLAAPRSGRPAPFIRNVGSFLSIGHFPSPLGTMGTRMTY